VDLYIYYPIRLHGIVLYLLSTGTTLAVPMNVHMYIFFPRLIMVGPI
jgi:hypothetical protein